MGTMGTLELMEPLGSAESRSKKHCSAVNQFSSRINSLEIMQRQLIAGNATVKINHRRILWSLPATASLSLSLSLCVCVCVCARVWIRDNYSQCSTTGNDSHVRPHTHTHTHTHTLAQITTVTGYRRMTAWLVYHLHAVNYRAVMG